MKKQTMKTFLMLGVMCGVAFPALAQDQMQPGVGGNYRPPVYEVQTRSGTVNLLGKDHLRARQSVMRAEPVSNSNAQEFSNVTPALSIINERYIPQSLQAQTQTQAQVQAQVSAPPQEIPQEMGMQSLPVPEAQTPSRIEPAAAPTRTQSPMVLQPQPVTEMPLDVTMTQPGDAGVMMRDNPASSFAPAAPSGTTQGWRARQGEEFNAVVARWAERLETKPTNIPQGNFVLSQDFSFFGSYDRAVEKLFEMRAQAPQTPQAPQAQPAAPTSVANVADFPQVDKVPPVQLTTPGARWFAMNGAPLNEVLKSWADQAGVAIVWQASPSLAVKSTLSQTSSFEDAVAQLLGQYDQDLSRPRGQLYRNPVDGKRVLVIREEKLGTPPQS